MKWLIPFFLISTAQAQTSVDFTLGSRHWSDREYKEVNPGIGIRRIEGHFGVTVGVYQNSYGKPSVYLFGLAQQNLGPLTVGIGAGVLTGYRNLPGNHLAGHLYAEKKVDGVTGRLLFAPSPDGSVLGLQIGVDL